MPEAEEETQLSTVTMVQPVGVGVDTSLVAEEGVEAVDVVVTMEETEGQLETSVPTLGVGVSRPALEDMAATEGAQENGLLIKLPTVTTSQHQVVMRDHLALEVEEVILVAIITVEVVEEVESNLAIPTSRLT